MQALLSYVNALPPGTSLTTKVQSVISYYNAGNHATACTALLSVISEANTQNRKHISSAQSATVIAMTKQDPGRHRLARNGARYPRGSLEGKQVEERSR
jgi:hypothetical protein